MLIVVVAMFESIGLLPCASATQSTTPLSLYKAAWKEKTDGESLWLHRGERTNTIVLTMIYSNSLCYGKLAYIFGYLETEKIDF